MRILIISSILITAWVASAKSSPSFDCKKAQTSDEKLICTSSALMTLDRDLNHVYVSRLKRDPGIKKDQVSWVQSRRSRCETDDISAEESAKAACLEFEYRRRAALLLLPQRPDGSTDKSVTEGSEGKVVFRQSFTRDDESRCLRYIDVYLPGQTVPQQTISQENCNYHRRPGDYLSFEDFNFDGYPDLSIWNAEASGATNLYYEVYLFDPGKRQFFEEPTFPDGGFPEVDKEKKLLLTHDNGGHAGRIGSNASYRYVNGKFQKASTERRQWIPDFCAERDNCYGKDAKKENCHLLNECRKDQQTLPQCKQYLRNRETFNEKGVLVISEEEVTVVDEDSRLKLVAAKVNCAAK